MVIYCKIDEIMEPKNVGSTKDFWVRNFSVITEELSKYPQTILLQAVMGAVDELEQYQPGDRIEAHAQLRGRKKDGKFYNCVEVKKINRG